MIIKKFEQFINESENLYGYDFVHGDCDIYAIALHRLYNYQLCAIRGSFLEDDWGGERETDYEYCHIMVRLPNGNYMDSEGEQTEEEILDADKLMFTEDVDEIEIVDITEDEAKRLFSGSIDYDEQKVSSKKENDIKKVMNFIKNIKHKMC